MLTKTNTYRQIFRATGLFGGVQVVQILSVLIRAKFIALFLGPLGMGISSLFLSTLTMMGHVVGLGLNFSAVRDLAQAKETQDLHKISRIIKVVRLWIWGCGVAGMVLTILFAHHLSLFAFGDETHAWAFVCLSSTLLFNALTAGNIALLQGMQRLHDLAIATVTASFIGLSTAIPLYYFWGINGIVPALILASLSACVTSFYLSRKIPRLPVLLSAKEAFNEGKEMAKLGIVMMISMFIGSLVAYLLNAFISHSGGIKDVGLYQAGISISNQYVGLIFGAMSMDYFPRLSAISGSNRKVRALVNQQGEIVLLMVAPLVIALIVTAPLVIRLLLSAEFYPITGLVRFIALGMLFKAASFAVGYISFAKGDKKVFLLVEGILGNLLTLALNLLAYHFWGLKGLGFSFLAGYALYFLLILVITRKLYAFRPGSGFIKLFLACFMLCLSALLVMISSDSVSSYLAGSFILLLAAGLSYRELDRRIGIKSLIKARLSPSSS